jgi:hypothetical protein
MMRFMYSFAIASAGLVHLVEAAELDLSFDRILDEGWSVLSELAAMDSSGFGRVTASIRSSGDDFTDTVPSWILHGVGTDGVETVYLDNMVTHRGGCHFSFDIRGHDDLVITYYILNGRDNTVTIFDDPVMALHLSRNGYTNASPAVYFSHWGMVEGSTFLMDKGAQAAYVIYKKRAIDRIPCDGITCLTLWNVIMSEEYVNRITFRQRSEIMKAVLDWGLLIRGETRLVDKWALFSQETKLIFADDGSMTIFPPRIGYAAVPSRYEGHTYMSAYFREFYTMLGHILHGGNFGIPATQYCDFMACLGEYPGFTNGAFFLESTTPGPDVVSWFGDNLVYHFRPLDEVLAGEWSGVDRDVIRSAFREYMAFVKRELLNPTKITDLSQFPSIAEMVDSRVAEAGH